MESQEDCFHLGVKALLCNSHGQLLLLKKKWADQFFWDIPGGRLKKGEAPLDALKREIEEETGLTHFGTPRFLSMLLTDVRLSTDNGDVGLIFSVYHCDIVSFDRIILSNEHVDYGWYMPSEAAILLSI